jgi:hypothetical protein
MKGIDFTGIAYLVAFGVAAYIAYQVWQKGPAAISAITDAAKSVGDAINPASSTNLVNKAANAVVQTVTGSSDETLGGWFYDALHPDPMKLMDQLTAAQIAKNNASLAGMDSFNPMSDLMTQMP